MPRLGSLTTRVNATVSAGSARREKRVLDLLALVEARAADHLVADPVAHEHVLEHAALGIGQAEDGDLVARLASEIDEPLDLRHHSSLGVLVLEARACNWSPLRAVVQSDFSLRERLFAITALDAFRIVCVER